MTWTKVKLGDLLVESKTPAVKPNPDKRIRVRLNMLGVEKRPLENEVEGATKQFVRKAGQFIYGKQNFHKGAFGIIPQNLDGFETSADIPSFDIRKDCFAEWIYYYFKINNRYIELEQLARGVGSKRIHPKQLFDIDIPLPGIKTQEIFINSFKALELQKSFLEKEAIAQLTLVKQLRQAFLREAMQGKLLPQNPNDEPASILLQKIKAQKEQLVKEKKLKKDKDLPSIKPEEIPYEIPENWVWCRLGEIIKLISGQDLNVSEYNEQSNGVPYITGASHFKKGNLEISRWTQTPKSLSHKGDLLITCKGTIGAMAYNVIGQLHIARQIMAIRNQYNINLQYIRYFINHYIDKLLAKAKSLIPGISRDDILFTLIPLPPLEEQHRIVARLEQLMAMCDKLENSIQQSQQQANALLQVALKEALQPKEEIQKEKPKLPKTPVINIKTHTQQPAVVDLFYKRACLAAEITYQCHKELSYGHVKLQKLVFLCEHAANMNLQHLYVKAAAGPYDYEFMHSIDDEFSDRNWFLAKERENGKGIYYVALTNANGYKNDYSLFYSDTDDKIQYLIGLLKTEKSDFCEAVATLFAVWLDLRKKREIPSLENLINNFYNWHEKKEKFTRNYLVKCMQWMIDKGVYPK